MATWFVRPNTAHNVTRDGTSYDFAFGGWSEILWGAGKVNTGDTLYVCGAHLYSAVIEPGAAGVSIRGDNASEAGSITLTGTSVYFNLNKSSTTFQALTFTSADRCIMPAAIAITGLTIKDCIFNGSSLPAIEFRSAAGGNWTNTIIDGNTFNGGTGGGAGAAISWWPQSAITTYHENIKITNNTFSGCSAAQGVIVLLAAPAAADTVHIYDLEVSGNTFTNCGGSAIKAYVPRIGQNKGVKVYKNTITNQKRVGNLGGGIVVGGFAHTDTPTFGWNVVEDNVADGLEGTTGFANIMYGAYIIRNNIGKNISSVIYDGCGLLFDHGADGCVAYGNYFENLTGPEDFTAGAGIGIIYEATNITCYGNVVKNAHIGVLYANQSQFCNSNIHNNTFINCKLAAIYGNETTFPADSNYCRNNIFTAVDATASAITYKTGAWSRETNNVFHGFKTGTQAIHSSSLTIDPNLASDFRAKASELKAAGTFLGGQDYYGKYFYNLPSIGAVEAKNPNARYLLKR